MSKGKHSKRHSVLPWSSSKDDDGWLFGSRCSHRGDPFLLPNGDTIYASGHHDLGHRTPDFGFYLDGMWKPKTIAFHIGWQDYGLPSLPFHQMAVLTGMALEQAANGAYVEVGCIGAHGRTGTFLSLLTLEAADLSGFATAHGAAWWAVGYVRKGHCTKAVETEEQEDYVWEYAKRLMA